ncbi:hypothetical protein [Olleya sp. Bg11-27]|uniref:hypothetical protein n=1 Tax=Olleya sp. Bg11-27 TaxID=2058135 RepID=UPI000C30F3E1|nr:hypothetical protein [Olleya sp. Bg11-27]AUC74942.1 hypothetical protein CW732_04330 [Olleya sp. Bg11-27]
MKNSLILLFLLISIQSFAQYYEGQNFCDELIDKSFFPIDIKEKKILWTNTYYAETKNGTKEINGKTYVEFLQKWKGNNTDKLYLREENGVIYQYEQCCEQETIRFDETFEKDHSWKTADALGEYKILTFIGKLKTPFCEYENLMIIEAKLESGNFNFYYQRGHGYIGATVENKLISCETPTFDLD